MIECVCMAVFICVYVCVCVLSTRPVDFVVVKSCIMFPGVVCVSYRKTSNISRTFVGNKIVDHCSWNIACRRCSNYIFILDLTFGFKGFGKDSHKTVREYFKCWDLVRLILETWRYLALSPHASGRPNMEGVAACRR